MTCGKVKGAGLGTKGMEGVFGKIKEKKLGGKGKGIYTHFM